MGGGLALLLAPGHEFAASSVNYGTAPGDAFTADFLARACPVVRVFGAKDRTLRGAAGLERALAPLGVEHDVKEYPGAGHSFLNDHDNPAEDPDMFAVMTKLSRGWATTRSRPGRQGGGFSRSSTRT